MRDRDRVVLVSHCVLNQSVRARWGSGEASRKKAMLVDVVDALRELGVGIIQMECPELRLYGNPRQPGTKDDYDTPEFRRICSKIAVWACNLIMEPTTEDARVDLIAVLGVEGSPSCGVGRTPRTVNGVQVDAMERGLLMEALETEMANRDLKAQFIGMSLREEEQEDRLRRLVAICSG